MTRMKSIFAMLLLTAIVSVVPQAHAQTAKVILAGSSAMWQSMAMFFVGCLALGSTDANAFKRKQWPTAEK